MNQLMYPGGVSADSKAKFASKLFPEDSAGRPVKGGQSFSALPNTCQSLPTGLGRLSHLQDGCFIVRLAPRHNGRRKSSTQRPRNGARVAMWPWSTPSLVEWHGFNAITPEVKQRYLSTLAYSPTRQRLGAGSAPLKWVSILPTALGSLLGSRPPLPAMASTRSLAMKMKC
ncbi:hypothetical protein N657DRAFT_242566 [Parathielavia appendiculata]|uniref:Uncharacterized protein n=1 Tax=Parathielavia appendiculata TaxID=2587402 RepID=A0AAN6TU46_9PEZI|nr:hypothetical protein N657DRAFT_242566 [Parathielavia appendiculata]